MGLSEIIWYLRFSKSILKRPPKDYQKIFSDYLRLSQIISDYLEETSKSFPSSLVLIIQKDQQSLRKNTIKISFWIPKTSKLNLEVNLDWFQRIIIRPHVEQFQFDQHASNFFFFYQIVFFQANIIDLVSKEYYKILWFVL